MTIRTHNICVLAFLAGVLASCAGDSVSYSEPKPCIDCELSDTRWFRDYGGGVVWEWFFGEADYLAGPLGLSDPIEGTWKAISGALLIHDNACVDPLSFEQVLGEYLIKITGTTLRVALLSDRCTPRANSLPGVWTSEVPAGKTNDESARWR